MRPLKLQKPVNAVIQSTKVTHCFIVFDNSLNPLVLMNHNPAASVCKTSLTGYVVEAGRAHFAPFPTCALP
ncbi:hypothetical protein BH20ACI3_BH20ACI3_07060 [soil metagenome]